MTYSSKFLRCHGFDTNSMKLSYALLGFSTHAKGWISPVQLQTNTNTASATLISALHVLWTLFGNDCPIPTALLNISQFIQTVSQHSPTKAHLPPKDQFRWRHQHLSRLRFQITFAIAIDRVENARPTQKKNSVLENTSIR